MVGVDGRVQTRTFEGQDGKTVFVTEIVADSVQFLESKGSSQTRGQDPSGFQPNHNQNQFQTQHEEDPFKNNGEPIDISDDDLPF
ncbi:single-strand DNA-binding protein [Virgibacillus campisalis]|uniref:Single-strand DNA-binding protein n=1 Tax=Virgibacillus alimentarius TaxID=698769 RepID=A0ABS4S9G5_9BACI|nr:single-strand DNA-binding protein [Virgibacillus alimentarius]